VIFGFFDKKRGFTPLFCGYQICSVRARCSFFYALGYAIFLARYPEFFEYVDKQAFDSSVLGIAVTGLRSNRAFIYAG
jgi:hypothetical protein